MQMTQELVAVSTRHCIVCTYLLQIFKGIRQRPSVDGSWCVCIELFWRKGSGFHLLVLMQRRTGKSSDVGNPVCGEVQARS
jgi:hypothetical protein